MQPGTKVRSRSHGHEGVVLPPSPLGYRFVMEYPDGTREDAVEVKWTDGEPGGGILSADDLEILDDN